MNSLKNKKVVIIGGSGGIGLVTAKMAHKKGAKIVIASRSLEKLKKAKAAIGSHVQIYQLDGTNDKQVCTFFSQVDDIDHLIIAADTAEDNIRGKDLKVARNPFDSKLWLQMYAVKYGTPKMVKQGAIILFSNTISRITENGSMTFTGIAASIESLGKMLAVELAPIRVNVITTGFIHSQKWNQVTLKEEQDGSFKNFTETLPLKKVRKTESVVKAVSFLMDNDFVTGSVIDVERGQQLI